MKTCGFRKGCKRKTRSSLGGTGEGGQIERLLAPLCVGIRVGLVEQHTPCERVHDTGGRVELLLPFGTADTATFHLERRYDLRDGVLRVQRLKIQGLIPSLLGLRTSRALGLECNLPKPEELGRSEIARHQLSRHSDRKGCGHDVVESGRWANGSLGHVRELAIGQYPGATPRKGCEWIVEHILDIGDRAGGDRELAHLLGEDDIVPIRSLPLVQLRPHLHHVLQTVGLHGADEQREATGELIRKSVAVVVLPVPAVQLRPQGERIGILIIAVTPLNGEVSHVGRFTDHETVAVTVLVHIPLEHAVAVLIRTHRVLGEQLIGDGAVERDFQELFERTGVRVEVLVVTVDLGHRRQLRDGHIPTLGAEAIMRQAHGLKRQGGGIAITVHILSAQGLVFIDHAIAVIVRLVEVVSIDIRMNVCILVIAVAVRKDVATERITVAKCSTHAITIQVVEDRMLGGHAPVLVRIRRCGAVGVGERTRVLEERVHGVGHGGLGWHAGHAQSQDERPHVSPRL